jgi:hypothetical protein
LVARNAANVARIQIGMTKPQVQEIMGILYGATKNGDVPNPAKSYTYTDRDGVIYEAHLYMPQMHRMFRRILDREATPVVFRDGKVCGWGWPAANAVGFHGP